MKWLVGAGLSVLFVWAVGAAFCDSPGQLMWDHGRSVVRRADYVTVQFRSEGWGDSRFGRTGLSAVDDIGSLTNPVVVLWGDSHIEALQVPDAEKPGVQLDSLLSRSGARCRAIAIALGGEMLADYLLKIPRYESLVSCCAHYIVISDLDEALPDRPGASYARFTATPALTVIPAAAGIISPSRTRIQRLLRAAHLEFVVPIYREVAGGDAGSSLLSRVRFRPGPVAPSRADPPPPLSVPPEAAWGYLLGRLAAQTTNPVTIVYAPRWPRVEGQVIERKDPSGPPLAAFAEACRGAGVGWIDLSADFLSHLDRTGRFPRGFPNSRPGEGHFNAGGHEIIAEAIHWDFGQKNHAVHAD
jgi:hypothetical protein